MSTSTPVFKNLSDLSETQKRNTLYVIKCQNGVNNDTFLCIFTIESMIRENRVLMIPALRPNKWLSMTPKIYVPVFVLKNCPDFPEETG